MPEETTNQTAAAPKKAAKKSTKKADKKASKKAKAPKKDAQGRGRVSMFAGKKIVKLVKENPRKDGSIGHKSFQLLKSGMTYEQYIKAGGRRGDLAYDLDHKFVKLA